MIEFRNVSKTYDTGTKAVKNANFVIDKGEFAFLVGTSGSGKSTLIKTATIISFIKILVIFLPIKMLVYMVLLLSRYQVQRSGR